MDYTKSLDYSSLSCYIDCPRKFLFKYVLHIRSKKPNINLVFGSCWHYGLEMAYKQMQVEQKSQTVFGTPADYTAISIAAFNDLWALEGAPHFDPDVVFPKNAGHAANMYHEYWKLYLNEDLQAMRVIAVEHPFSLDLSRFGSDLPAYIGRMDLVLENSDRSLTIMDHKTAKAVNAMTFTSYEASLQTDGYLTVGNIYYDKIPTMLYSVAMCQKTEIKFQRFPIIKPKITIDRFLTDLVMYAREIISNLNRFKEECLQFTQRNDLISCFPRSPGYACTAYFRPCSYYRLCKMRANPLLWKDNPPAGFDIYEWDPNTHEENIRKKLKEAKDA